MTLGPGRVLFDIPKFNIGLFHGVARVALGRPNRFLRKPNQMLPAKQGSSKGLPKTFKSQEIWTVLPNFSPHLQSLKKVFIMTITDFWVTYAMASHLHHSHTPTVQLIELDEKFTDIEDILDHGMLLQVNIGG